MTSLPARVLDVSNDRVRLHETRGEHGSYLTLSHCWGRNPIVRTFKENYAVHREGIAWKALSKTFQDAVILTRRLGYQYLWIDSLCIVQDDPKDWEGQASQMAQIYSNSDLTIAATKSEDESRGCFSNRLDDLYILKVDGEERHVRDPRIWELYTVTGTDRDGIEARF